MDIITLTDWSSETSHSESVRALLADGSPPPEELSVEKKTNKNFDSQSVYK